MRPSVLLSWDLSHAPADHSAGRVLFRELEGGLGPQCHTHAFQTEMNNEVNDDFCSSRTPLLRLRLQYLETCLNCHINDSFVTREALLAICSRMAINFQGTRIQGLAPVRSCMQARQARALQQILFRRVLVVGQRITTSAAGRVCNSPPIRPSSWEYPTAEGKWFSKPTPQPFLSAKLSNKLSRLSLRAKG